MSAKELFAEELRNRLVKQSRNLSFDMCIDVTGYIYCEMSINKDLSVVVDLHLSDEEVNDYASYSDLEDLFDQAIHAVKNETNKLFWR